MKKPTLILLTLIALLGGGWLFAQTREVKPSAVAPTPEPGFIAHEWGTFTDVQGADGQQLPWYAAGAQDLPSFVFRQPGFDKSGMVMRQRMETPVIYFYTDRPRTIDVAIDFPLGKVTEWYPLDAALDRTFVLLNTPRKNPLLRWKELQIIPPTAAATAALPTEAAASHYYAARETDAALVQVQEGEKTETEKFLFYRGVASFEAPLTVKMNAAQPGEVTLQNTGKEPLAHLFLYQVTAQGGRWLSVPALAPGATCAVTLPEKATAPFSELAPAMRQALVAEGLFEKEAAAMVKTWEDAWFTERGLRVLYTLPRAWTDRILPLQITAAPQKVERVMVGRAEILSPALEETLVKNIQRVMSTPADRAAAVQETIELGLGRFLHPALQRVRTRDTRPEYEAAWLDLYNAVAQSMAPKIAATAMSLRLSLLLLLAALLPGRAEDLATAEKRLATLQQRAVALKPGSTPAEVEALLGAPASKGMAGWHDPDTKVWSYIDCADDAQFLSFTVTFDLKKGTIAGGSHTLRKEIEKLATRVDAGTVLAVHPHYDSPAGLWCEVKFDDGTSQGVFVLNQLRVKGTPAVGSRLRVTHRGSAGFYNFVGQGSLYLEQIEFQP